LPGSLQGKISSDGCLKKEQMVVSAIASTPHSAFVYLQIRRCLFTSEDFFFHLESPFIGLVLLR
ncbi:hypothetical protein, partial [Shigella flexneri]